MKVLLLSRYPRLGASSRLRTMQYIPALNAQGIQVDVCPFFDAEYLNALYSNSRQRVSALRYFLKRIAVLRKKRSSCDLIWLEKEALPWMPWIIERYLIGRGKPIVVDYDDAIFHRYDHHARYLVRSLLGSKIDSVMANATVVTAGNEYLAERARRAGSERVEYVPTVVDLEAYAPKGFVDQERGGSACIGWIGTPGTWSDWGRPMVPMLKELKSEYGARLIAIGAATDHATVDGVELIPWSEKSEIELLSNLDIGIMPLPDEPWTRGKCGYKLIQYMACGLPVVASPVGVNSKIVEHGVNGFLAQTNEEWREALTLLLNDADLRRRMGEAGRRRVEEEYSLQVWGPKVADLLSSVAERQN